MKRFIVLICLLFACHLLFAEGLTKEDKVFFEREYKVSDLGFYESSNLEKTNGYKYYISIYDYESKEEVIVNYILCNDYETIKNFFYKVRERGLALKEPYFHLYIWSCITLKEYGQPIADITEVYSNKDFIEGRNMIQDLHIYVLK